MKFFHRIGRSLTYSQPSVSHQCKLGTSFWWITRSFSGRCNIDDDDAILPVVIVGAGPVGLVLSMLLTKLGVRCAVLEKGETFSRHPQAHFINNRTMEIFRKLDGLADEIQSSQPPVELWRKFIYCTSLSGPILGSVDHIKPQDLEQVVSPVSVAHFSQYKLVQLLLKRLKCLDFHVHTSEGLESLEPVRERQILMGHELLSIDGADKYLNINVSFHEQGKYKERNIRCAILVGADGAGSTVRKLAGIEMVGETDLQKLISVHFISKELGDYLLNERPGMLFFIYNTEAIGVLVAHDLGQGEFVLQVPYFPPQQTLEDFNPKMCEKLISKLVGRELGDVHVVDIKPWIMHAEVADKFLSYDNRVIIAGDAAHRFPPAGGFGMNTGIQDAHNLAWKLASVVSGIAPATLLETYEMERKPIATYNTELSVQNFQAALEVPSALGLDPKIAKSVHRVINEGLSSILPSGLQKVILEGVFSIGRSQVSNAILNYKNPIGSSRLERLKQIFEEGKSLQLQFPAEDLGFRYVRGALVGASDATPEAPTGRRRDYVPSAEPGLRLPHMSVRALSAKTSKEIISVQDLISGDELEFLLLISPHKESYYLASVTAQVAKKFKVLLKIGIFWQPGQYTQKGSDQVGSSFDLSPLKNVIDVVEEKSLNSQSWWEICKMSDRGAILVRPDEHIAWSSKSGIVEDPMAVMENVFSAVLGFR